MQLLCSKFIEADATNVPLIAMGDLNARMGGLNLISDVYSYEKNVDIIMNENGKHVKDILFNATSALPLNHLKSSEHTFDGDFTFKRNEKQSQIDWC